MTATQALAKNNFPPEKLIAYARHIANRKTTTHTHPDRQEDLISYLIETGLRYAIRYDPKRTSHTHSYTFSSYIYDIMETRVPDFYRRQSEGYADLRKGPPGKPRQPHETTDPDDLKTYEAQTDALEKLISDDQRSRYTTAAAQAGVTLAEWITTTLDQAT